MRWTPRFLVSSLLFTTIAAVACGSSKDSNYKNPAGFGGSAASSGTSGTGNGGSGNGSGNGGSGNGTGNGGSGNGTGNGGSGNGSGNGGSGNGSGNGGSGNGSGNGGMGNFGGGGPGCDGTKRPAEDPCVIHEDFAVFVSPYGDDFSGDGSRDKPFKTFAAALNEASYSSKRVYACATAGTYNETVTLDSLADGVSLFGGFDCSSWNYQPGAKTKISGSNKGALKVTGLTKATTIEDFDVTAQPATSPGSSSVGIVVANSGNVTLRRVKATAGQGATGINGYTTPGVAKGGKLGNPGKPPCQIDFTGGASVATGCGTTDAVGGKGGYGGKGTLAPGNGDSGLPNVQGGLGGLGATKDTNGNPISCKNGAPGKAGIDGLPGAGGKTPGTLTASGWNPSSGETGGSGGLGQGGGGGGGAWPPSDCGISGPNPPTGASGGSGGSGGCGGDGGEGGQGGGASIAFISYQSTVTLDGVDLVATTGGKGGNGGKGQAGGAGASGAGGGSTACNGGAGGKGGNGAAGGGGSGGPSIGMAYKGTKPVRVGGSTVVASTAALGGADGNGASSGTGAGAPGILKQEQAF